MVRDKSTALAFVFLFVFTGCKGPSSSDLEFLKKEWAELKGKQEWNEIKKALDSIAYLTPGSEGYSPVMFDLGSLVVQLADIKPYANGSKVVLKFGNPLAASIDGLKLKLEWGKVDPKGSPQNETVRSKDLVISKLIRSGAWTSVPVVLDGIPPGELGFVRVSNITHTGIRLNK